MIMAAAKKKKPVAKKKKPKQIAMPGNGFKLEKKKSKTKKA